MVVAPREIIEFSVLFWVFFFFLFLDDPSEMYDTRQVKTLQSQLSPSYKTFFS